MKKLFEKLNLPFAAVFTVAAALFAFSFFSADGAYIQKSNITELQAPDRPVLPVKETNVQTVLVRNTSPAVNTTRNEKTSNPPLNRAYEALFQRSFVQLSVIHSAAAPQAVLILRKKYLKNSITARAGPFQHYCAA